MHGVDVAIFRWINGWTDDMAPFFGFLSEGNKMLGVKIAALLLIIIFLAAGKQTRKAAILAIISVALANTLTNLLKDGFPMARPCVSPDVLAFIMPHRVGWLTSSGTASAHAANMAAVATVITYFFEWWGAIPIFIAFLVGLSRIYVGVHFPSQVLLGWICGVVMAGLVLLLYRQIELARAEKDTKPQSE